MAALLGAILAAIVVVVLLYPLVRRPRTYHAAVPDVEESRTARHNVYREIANLRNDFESGHISESEYQQQLQPLRKAAALALRDEDEARTSEIATELNIETEVRQLRNAIRDEDTTTP